MKPQGGMKVEGRVFGILAVFVLFAGIIYLFISKEYTGATCLLVTTGLFLIVGYYLWFTGRRLDGPRPEDRLDAEIEDGAGEVGFFPPHSWWPIALAAAFGMCMLGIIFGWWLFFVGAIFAFWAVSGFVLEYYRQTPEDAIPPH